MKSNVLKFGLCLAIGGLLITDASAQRTPRKRNTNNSNTQSNSGRDTIPTQGNNNNNLPPVDYNVLANLPITYDTTSADVQGKPSLRNDNAFDKSNLTQRNPLPYEHLRWDDALYAEKVWRELDLREKMNKTFSYEAVDDNGSQMFVSMVMKVVQSGQVTAFGDDRFTTPLQLADVQQLTAGKLDSQYVYDIKQIDKIVGINVSRTSFDPKLVTKIRLKEEWVFDRESSRMFVRILGIGLLKDEYFPGTTKPRGTSALFWLYYPDLRPMLAKNEVYNPKNMGQSRMTWEELFESRMFSSYIVKSTLDNPANKQIRQYINDPILRLLEGDNIKEKIFNFEQDLWSY
jgi:gliding motility associated protien GldN